MALPREPQTIDFFIANSRLNIPRSAGAVLNAALEKPADDETDDEQQEDVDGGLWGSCSGIDPGACEPRQESFEELQQVIDSSARDLIDLFGLVTPIEQRVDQREREGKDQSD